MFGLHRVQCFPADSRALQLVLAQAQFDVRVRQLRRLVHDGQVTRRNNTGLEDAGHGKEAGVVSVLTREPGATNETNQR